MKRVKLEHDTDALPKLSPRMLELRYDHDGLVGVSLNVDSDGRVVVTDITHDSWNMWCGIQRGDIIVEVAGVRLEKGDHAALTCGAMIKEHGRTECAIKILVDPSVTTASRAKQVIYNAYQNLHPCSQRELLAELSDSHVQVRNDLGVNLSHRRAELMEELSRRWDEDALIYYSQRARLHTYANSPTSLQDHLLNADRMGRLPQMKETMAKLVSQSGIKKAKYVSRTRQLLEELGEAAGYHSHNTSTRFSPSYSQVY